MLPGRTALAYASSGPILTKLVSATNLAALLGVRLPTGRAVTDPGEPKTAAELKEMWRTNVWSCGTPGCHGDSAVSKTIELFLDTIEQLGKDRDIAVNQRNRAEIELMYLKRHLSLRIPGGGPN